jgi:antitoxin VapB
MGLNIKNVEVERLAAEIATETGETKTEAIRIALLQRKERLALPSIEARWAQIQQSMEAEVWSKIPPEMRGKRISRSEQDEILGFGPAGF